MYGFQQLAYDMIEIAQQSQQQRKQLTLKWLTNMLGEFEKPIIRSPFRTANPVSFDTSDRQISEKILIRHITKLQTFARNRKIQRQPITQKEIQRQFSEEATGIPVENLSMNVLAQNAYENILQISGGQASLIFESEDSYNFMIIENKSLDPVVQAATGLNQSIMRKRQAQNLIRKINIGDVSFISTDLDQTTQFDFSNKRNKQVFYNIRLYGRISSLYEETLNENSIVAPSQLGLDIPRQSRPRYRISINNIRFPQHLATQTQAKTTFYAKIYQSFDPLMPSEKDQFKSSAEVFEATSQCIKIKGFKSGIVYPQAASFNVNTLSQSANERFGVGLVIRVNGQPVPMVTERLMHQEELKSFEQKQFFSYKNLNTEQSVTLRDFQGKQFEITFSVSEISPNSQDVKMTERQGRRLLIGRYVLFQGKVAYVKSLLGNGLIEIVEIVSKKDRTIHWKNVALIETHGVSVFKLDKEPLIVSKSRYDWIIDLKVCDKKMLNCIHSKIQFRQAHLALQEQDTKTKDDLSTIEGSMVISLLETKGLIVQTEVNRRQQDLSKRIDPVVEVRLERFSGETLKTHVGDVIKNRREVVWGQSSKKNGDELGEFIINLGQVNHSGRLQADQIQVQRSKRTNTVTKPGNGRDLMHGDSLFIHLLVNNAVDGKMIGDAKIELDELIDINLADLAKEYCVCLNRSHLLEDMAKQATAGGKSKEAVQQEMSMYTQYSGIIRFQTLFQPTKDTSLRFEQVRDTSIFKSPKPLLHLEYLLAKNACDSFRYKIPQLSYNPNNKTQGEDLLDLPNLIAQCSGNQKIQNLLKTIQSSGAAQAKVYSSQRISDQVIKEIGQTVMFQSPFEKIYIILKLQRKERPFLEQVFLSFKNSWDIYTQVVKNQGFDSLNLNEWLSFIDELASKNNFAQMDEVFDIANDAVDDEDMDSRSVSFVRTMVQQMKNKAAGLKRQSSMIAGQLENGSAGDAKQFSLVLCQEWEREGNQSFIDLVNLVKCGIPNMLRTVVWGDLMKTNLIAIEERKQMLKNYSKKYNRQISTFENFMEISQKYDCIAFKQIDQDISDFKFPANYYETATSQSSSLLYSYKQSGSQAASAESINRINKFKHDKQQMRKLLRILLLWGKNFKSKGIKYQLSYPTGFLKVVHRFINLMSMEDAFWILIGFIRQYPRLWCLQESCMLDEAKSNFRFELTVIRSIIEVYLPNISQKLYQLGLPAEIFVYDSVSSLYCDFFHSETLLRIWDLMIFYFNTSEHKRGIWLLLAPAIMILKMKQKDILQAQSAKEVIDCYKDGCSLDYNPNHVIQMLNDVIDEIFVTEGKQQNKSGILSSVGAFESGGTGYGEKDSKVSQVGSSFFAGLFSSNIAPLNQAASSNPVKIDEVRRTFQQKQNLIFQETRSHNRVVSNFLFKNSNESNIKKDGKNRVGKRKNSEDSMEFENEGQSKRASQAVKPSSHQTLNYRQWRMDILPAIQNQLLMTEEIDDDELHEFEEKQIYQKVNLDVKVLHLYLHNLENWYGTEDGTQDFMIQVQYGRLHPNNKFEVKHMTKDDEDCYKKDSILQYFCNFKYSQGFNHLKVKIMTTTKERACHCYVDLRGHQRGKFIHFQKTINAKEYTQNPESQFPLTQLKMSLFLESKKENVSEDQLHNSQDEEINKMTYLYSLKKYEPGQINIYRAAKELGFQKTLHSQLQNSVQSDYQNFKQYLKQDVVIDILNYKYNFTEILPRTKFGHLSLQLFKNFVEKCMPDHANSASTTEFNQLYNDFLSLKSETSQEPSLIPKDLEQVTAENLISKCAVLDTDKINEAQDQTPEARVFSLRSFVFTVLLQSPITVKEKLDILYDITDMSNKFVDGIDVHDALMIYKTILQQHLYYIPQNELRNIVEIVFNEGEISEIIGAYWTNKSSQEIKYDIFKNEQSGFSQLNDFLLKEKGKEKSNTVDASGNYVENSAKPNVVDLTKEVQETFVMYQNLFGNKVLDFNDDSSPFKSFNNLFASTGKQDLGKLILDKTRSLGEANCQKYRLCIVSKISGGERILTEIRYKPDDGDLLVDEEKQPRDRNKFKRFFMKNINILDLSGKQQALSKTEFISGSKKVPFLYDLMRAETFWQDRTLDQSTGHDGVMQSTSSAAVLGASLQMKKKFKPIVNVFLSDKDKIFIFKFENRVMGGRTESTQIKELVRNQIYLFEIEALFSEDIVLDMRDRIVQELHKISESSMHLRSEFISEIEGKMEFYVRKVLVQDAKAQLLSKGNEQGNIIQESVIKNTSDFRWLWKKVNDFDRLEKFSDDEIFEDEVVFKLAKSKAGEEDDLDEKPDHIRQGYDCFSIYKHHDNSYEWRLCKIIGKEIKPEFKQMALEAFLPKGKKFAHNEDGNDDINLQSQIKFGYNQKASAHESDQYYYFLEFYHLKEYGREMWVKRRREDLVFSSRFERDQQTFERNCFKFILETYKR